MLEGEHLTFNESQRTDMSWHLLMDIDQNELATAMITVKDTEVPTVYNLKWMGVVLECWQIVLIST